MSNPYADYYLSEEKRILAEKAAIEVDGMVERALRCPHCAHMAGVVYEDPHTVYTSIIAQWYGFLLPFILMVEVVYGH